METLFSIANLTVMPFWLSLILAPRTRWTDRLMRSPLVVLPPIALYAALVLPALGVVLPAVARPELSGVVALLGTPLGTTAAWTHFLAFDLFIGRWIYLDARDRSLAAPLLSVILLATLVLGPLGLATYLAARAGLGARLRRAFRLAAAGSRSLAWTGLGCALLLLVNLGLMIADPRVLGGAPLWLKPAKFAASVAITAFTLAALLRHLGPSTRGTRRATGIIVAMVAIELVIIDGQALRGLSSHFNVSTRFNGVAFAIMGTAITVLTGAVAYLGWIAFRRPIADRALAWGIRLGFVAMLFGSVIAFLMPRATPAQIASLRAGQPTPVVGAHAVGVPDGGPGLPITRWSTEGGDLRVPHFIGLHGLQILPIAGWLLGRRRRAQPRTSRLPAEATARLSFVAGAGYLGLVATTLIQALRGRPLASPDAVTLAFGAAVLGACLGASLWVFLSATLPRVRARRILGAAA